MVIISKYFLPTLYPYDLPLCLVNMSNIFERPAPPQDGVNGLWTEKEMTVEAIVDQERENLTRYWYPEMAGMFLSLEKSIDQIAIDWDRIDRYNMRKICDTGIMWSN